MAAGSGRRIRLVLGGVVVLAFGLLFLVPINIGFLKGAVSGAVKEATGLQIEIAGPLRVRLGLRPVVTAANITLQTPDARTIATFGEAAIALKPMALWRGDIFLGDLKVEQSVVDVCPALPDVTSTADAMPKLAADHLELVNVELRCQGTAVRPSWRLTLDPVVGRLSTTGQFTLDGAATLDVPPFDDTPFVAHLDGGDVNAFLTRAQSLAGDFDVEFGGASVAGKIEIGALETDFKISATARVSSSRSKRSSV